MELKLQEIEFAAQRLKPVLHHTELDMSSTFSAMTGGQIYLKCENRQKTGSFKIRGASNKIAALVERGEVKSVVASSAGNHAQGVAFAAKNFGIPATIAMPATAPIAKVQATQGYGANVVLSGDCYDDAYAKACEICEAEGATFLHPYNDLEVIAGQGTLGLEILSDLPTVDVVIVPAGGGGLLAGVAACIKQINPRIRIVGVQAEGANAIAQSFREKRYISTDTVSTIADGIAVKAPGDITVELINRYVDDVVTVSDMEISDAILMLMERCKQIVEPSGATPVAAVLNGKVDVKGKKAVCLLSGGNIDVSFIQCIIEQGLVSRHRRLKFTVTLLDKPGSLGGLLNDVAALGANILSVEHDRLSAGLNPNETNVHIACEVGGEAHGKNVVAELKNKGYQLNIH
ncbi:MAG: threonine ammonia-lyase [Oscillospiraceae bacterium]|nr:threonine ammonia-lyase [Oscillospiraceae bacterium]